MSTRKIRVSRPHIEPYDVRLGTQTLKGFGEHLKDTLGHARHAAVITDAAFGATAGLQVVEELLSAGFIVDDFQVPSGRAYRSCEYAMTVADRMAQADLKDRDCVVAVGGEDVIAIGRFIAATFAGGMNFAAVPTTLDAILTITDSTAELDLPGSVGFLGADKAPRLVTFDLDHLPKEIPDPAYPQAIDVAARDSFEHALAVFAQSSFATSRSDYAYLERNADQFITVKRMEPSFESTLVEALVRVVDSRAREVKRVDEARAQKEDLRLSKLDVGVTFARALERACGKGVLTKGQLLAEGLRFESLLSVEFAGLPTEHALGLFALLEAMGCTIPGVSVTPQALLDALRYTRPRRTKRLYFALMSDIQEYEVVGLAPDEIMPHLNAYAASRQQLLAPSQDPEVAEKRAQIDEARDEDGEDERSSEGVRSSSMCVDPSDEPSSANSGSEQDVSSDTATHLNSSPA